MADTDGDDVEGDDVAGDGDADGAGPGWDGSMGNSENEPARDGRDDPAMDGENEPTDDEDAGGPLDAADLLGSRLEPGSPSLENAAFVVLGMVAAVVVWLLLLP